jgi:4-hydroxybenzoate polyprenyltransferase
VSGVAAAHPASIRRVLHFIRFSHTVFALPFALASMLVAARGLPGIRTSVLIVLAMILARTAAMTFNRLADWHIDQRNPRTAHRHKLLSHVGAIVLLVASSVAFIVTTWFINRPCFWLSPVALAIVFFYSLTKRFTFFTHFFLGLALAVSPVGAWLAVRGEFALPPLVLAFAVLLWVSGFDIIYATMDHDFDRAEGLGSLVVWLGLPRSLLLAQALHWLTLGAFAVFGWSAALGTIYFGSLVLIGGAIVYEHQSAARMDVAGINRAFFACNAFVGLVFLAAVALDLSVRSRLI